MNNKQLAKAVKQPRHLLVVTPPAVAPKQKLARFTSVVEMVETLKPLDPVHVVRPDVVSHAATWFTQSFPGQVMYSVKSNPDPVVMRHLARAGIKHFDVASLPEIELVAKEFPNAKMHYMHPVKSRAAIARAYFDYGVRSFSLDSYEELFKILEVTGNARDLFLFLRIAIPNEHAAYALTGKFGVPAGEAAKLLIACREASRKLGICFHVGSQCMDPLAYRNALSQVKGLLDATGVKLDALDVGGGFPSIYPGMTPPPLDSYMDEIKQSLNAFGFNTPGLEIFAEPGRALVAESGSVVVRVELRKGDKLHINDGTYGSLFDAGHPGFIFPTKAIRPYDTLSDELIPFGFFGPTCDSLDAMKGPFMLPKDIDEGDWIEIGQLGAYGATLRTKFNGFYSDQMVEVKDRPLMSLLGNSREV